MTISFEHGGDLEKAAQIAGGSPADILDFSNLLNPLGAPPGLEDALKAQLGSSFRHPSSGDALKTKLAKKLGVSPEQVFLGAGTTEFIHFLPLWRKPQRPVIVGPTYGDYAPALRRLGAEPQLLLAKEENDWVISSQQWEACFKDKPDFMILSRPNNPLGQSIYRSLLKDMIQSHPETFFVVDETCIEIADDPTDHFILPSWPMNLAVLRSFSKTYAVPGLRLGYLVVSPNLVPQLKNFQMPWTVSPLALAAGLYLTYQDNWLAETQKANRTEKDRVLARLGSLKTFKVIPSGMTAFTLKGLTPGFSSSKLLERLLVEEKLLIRSLAQHEGMGDTFFRIGLKTPAENQKLAAALQKRDS